MHTTRVSTSSEIKFQKHIKCKQLLNSSSSTPRLRTLTALRRVKILKFRKNLEWNLSREFCWRLMYYDLWRRCQWAFDRYFTPKRAQLKSAFDKHRSFFVDVPNWVSRVPSGVFLTIFRGREKKKTFSPLWTLGPLVWSKFSFSAASASGAAKNGFLRLVMMGGRCKFEKSQEHPPPLDQSSSFKIIWNFLKERFKK